jgi:hypothetical protein
VGRWAGTGDRGRKSRREEHNGGLDEVAVLARPVRQRCGDRDSAALGGDRRPREEDEE